MFRSKNLFPELKHRAIFGLCFSVFAFAGERARQIITATERVGVFRSKNLFQELKHRAIFDLCFGVFALGGKRVRQIITATERIGVFRSKNLFPELKHRAMFGLRFGVFAFARERIRQIITATERVGVFRSNYLLAYVYHVPENCFCFRGMPLVIEDESNLILHTRPFQRIALAIRKRGSSAEVIQCPGVLDSILC